GRAAGERWQGGRPGLRRRGRGDRGGGVRGDGTRRPVLRIRRAQWRVCPDRPARGGTAWWDRARGRAGTVRPRRRVWGGPAGAVRGGGGPDQAGHRADLPAGAGRRRPRGHGGPRRHRKNLAPDLSYQERGKRSPYSSARDGGGTQPWPSRDARNSPPSRTR